MKSGRCRYCGCAGCSAEVDAVISHPDHGERAVCERHADDFEVIRHV